ncbi:Cytochrome P450 [Geodermatophilus amargosae]|uniref:Cytochrome P450 n=1 Tax=Geodermatophilus amargosae TaxID=1296565 RepID=A0A1I6YIH0_9ACTN|nr:cytochrome P450 [Geodermatophilus amargosae]SFT50250.1 Cytochrome P450 [Geodermatophilus amargosae]
MSAPPAVRTPPSAAGRGRSWLGRLALRRIRRRGLDPSRLTFLPRAARVPLQRVGVHPVPRLAELRVSGPVHRLDLPFDLSAHLVTGAAEARAVLADSAGFSTDVRHLFSGTGPATADDVGGLGPTDPPQHTRLRGLVAPDFTRARMQRLEPAVEETVARALDELAAAGSPADLVRHVAMPVPMTTICTLLGLDGADEQVVSRLGTRRFDATGGTAGTFGAVSAQRRLLVDAVAAQRRAPGDGLIGRIIRTEGDAVSDAELAGLADGIVTGGFETTASMIALGTLVLLGDPAAAALVRDGSRRDVERVVDELLRLLSVVQVAFPRFAREEQELFGTRLRAGDVVLVSLSGADRDPAWAGAHPDRLDPARSTRGAHLAFGHGIHRCVGAELARLELRIVLPALLRRFPDLALAVPPDRLPFRRLAFVFGVDALPVAF